MTGSLVKKSINICLTIGLTLPITDPNYDVLEIWDHLLPQKFEKFGTQISE